MAKKNPGIAEARKAINVDAYVSKGGLKTLYPHPNEIFGPFLDSLEGQTVERVVVQTMNPVATREEGGETHQAFGRMKVEALLGDEDQFGSRQTVGKVYVFDHKNAHYVVYGGHRAMVCLNLHILTADQLFNVSATDETFGNDATNRILDSIAEQQAQWEQHAAELQAITLDTSATQRALGDLLIRGVGTVSNDGTGFGGEVVSNAARLISDPTSRYAFDADGKITGWTLQQALTQTITDRTYINQAPQKTLNVVRAVRGVLSLN